MPLFAYERRVSVSMTPSGVVVSCNFPPLRGAVESSLGNLGAVLSGEGDLTCSHASVEDVLEAIRGVLSGYGGSLICSIKSPF